MSEGCNEKKCFEKKYFVCVCFVKNDGYGCLMWVMVVMVLCDVFGLRFWIRFKMFVIFEKLILLLLKFVGDVVIVKFVWVKV